MENSKKAPATIDEYIANFPENIQTLLQTMRQTIHAAAPQASELISYGMPAFRQKKNLVYFAAAKHHIGFYPTSEAIAAFQSRSSRPTKAPKGRSSSRYDQPLPLDLITRNRQTPRRAGRRKPVVAASRSRCPFPSPRRRNPPCSRPDVSIAVFACILRIFRHFVRKDRAILSGLFCASLDIISVCFVI